MYAQIKEGEFYGYRKRYGKDGLGFFLLCYM